MFIGKAAHFNKDVNKLKVNLRPNSAFLAEFQNADVEVLGVADVDGSFLKQARTIVLDHILTVV